MRDRQQSTEDPIHEEKSSLLSARGQTIEEALELAGGIGRYQVYVLITCALCYASLGYLAYNLAYLEIYPDYDCKLNGEPKDCDHDDFCHNGKV